jgi:hypothetical protein
MTGATEIANVGLRHLGTGQHIDDLDTDQSEEARVMRDIYQPTLEELLQRFNWWFATKYAIMNLVSLYPNQEWAFSYRMPNDCLNFKRIWNGFHTDDAKNMIRFVETFDSAGLLILSDYGPTELLSGDPSNPAPPPVPLPSPLSVISLGQYITDTPNTNLMTAMFKMSFSFFLAAYAAPSLAGVSGVDLGAKNLTIGEQKLAMAIARDQNQVKEPKDFKSILEKARTGGDAANVNAGTWQAFPSNYVP